MNKRDTAFLVSLNACRDARTWAAAYPTLDAAWQACDRPEWMFWLIAHTVAPTPESPGRRWLVLMAAQCADAVPQVGAGAEAVALAQRWGAGDDAVTLEMLAAASAAASDAASAAASDAASDAAWAAAWAAALAAERDAARASQCALIRELFPHPPTEVL